MSLENSQIHNRPNNEVKMTYDSFEKRIANKKSKT
jgi:YD repeat-containing protein